MGDHLPRVVALFNYDARAAEELSFLQGDIITILNVRDDDWLEGALDGREGFVPTAYVKPKAKDEAKDDAKDDAMKEGSAPPSADSKHFLGQMESYNTPLKERPNLAKAVQMHHVKAKHMPPQSSANGLHEFKRQVTQIKQGGRAKKQESEFELALRRRSEHMLGQEKAKPESELQRRLSSRFKD